MYFIFAILLFASSAAAITATTSSGNLTVDTGGGLIVTFETNKCDIISILYDGIEYQSSEYSHLASGLGSDANLNYTVTDDSILVTCDIENDNFNLTQYHAFIDGDPTFYLATYTYSNPSVGELRFLFRLKNLIGAWPTGIVSDTRNGTVIEFSDIWKVDGETRAKHYSSERFIDDQISCAYHDNIYACFIKPIRGYEASTGGPFARDIRLNRIKDDQHDCTYYMNHGENPWDVIRFGFHGPYMFTFSKGLPDAESFDYSFIEDLGLVGYLGDSERGKVVGAATGSSGAFPIVVHWYNDQHQQWVYANSTGHFESPLLSPGIYTQAFYQDELLAGTTTVTVEAGYTATATLTASNPIITESRTKIFQIGSYDGRPKGFLNADKQERMHVSDDRMYDWDTDTYIIGTNTTNEFPMAIFEDINNNRTIQFTLSSAIKTAAAIRIGTTISYLNGKPTVLVNSYDCGEFDDPDGVSSRGITKGKTHGDMTVYYCKIPVGTLVKGTNTITLGVTSSESGSGEWLSPNYMLDFIELYH